MAKQTIHKRITSFITFSFLNYSQAIFSILITIYLSRNLHKYDFGLFAFGIALAAIVSVLCQYGTDKTLIRDLYHKVNPESTLVENTVVKLLVGLTIGVLINIYSVINYQNDEKLIVIFFTLYSICIALSPRPWYDYKGKINIHSALFSLEKATLLITIIILIRSLEHKILFCSIAFFISRFFGLLLEFYLIRDIFRKFTLKVNLSILKVNFLLLLAAASNITITHFNQIYFKHIDAVEQLATFAIAFQITSVARVFQSQLLRFLSPEISKITKSLKKNTLTRKYLQHISLSVCVTLVICLAIFFFGRQILRVFGPNYTDALIPLQILTAWIMIYSIAVINSQYIISFHLEKYFFIIVLMTGILSILFSIKLVPLYLGIGAALVLFISSSISIISQFIVVVNHIRNAK